ncbi:MAG: hypothetical protein ACJ71S_03720, partial [Acidobacteriaceae bacterium]
GMNTILAFVLSSVITASPETVHVQTGGTGVSLDAAAITLSSHPAPSWRSTPHSLYRTGLPAHLNEIEAHKSGCRVTEEDVGLSQVAAQNQT